MDAVRRTRQPFGLNASGRFVSKKFEGEKLQEERKSDDGSNRAVVQQANS
jgi:hypothetical protein